MACQHNCSSCGSCSSTAIFTNQSYSSSGGGGGSYSGNSDSSYSSSGSYSSLDSMISAYQGGDSSSGDYSGISMSAMKNDYVINLDSIVIPVIYESKTSNNSGSQENHQNNYQNKSIGQEYKLTTAPGMIFTPSPFLKNNRPYTMFVGQAYEIQDFIKEAFKATTGNELPKDVVIEVCSREKMKETHEAFGGAWCNNIQGFAINKKHIGDDSLVFVGSGPLDKVMLTIGHEIGHVMSKSLKDIHSEEAKAFAFSIAWMKAIKENNIAGLADSIELDEPARNGLHNVALEFVLNTIKTGRSAMEVFVEIAESKFSYCAE